MGRHSRASSALRSFASMQSAPLSLSMAHFDVYALYRVAGLECALSSSPEGFPHSFHTLWITLCTFHNVWKTMWKTLTWVDHSSPIIVMIPRKKMQQKSCNATCCVVQFRPTAVRLDWTDAPGQAARTARRGPRGPLLCLSSCSPY